jgi:hypothetical protein
MYASFLGISEALHMNIFHQPLRSRSSHSLRYNENEIYTTQDGWTPYPRAWLLLVCFRQTHRESEIMVSLRDEGSLF